MEDPRNIGFVCKDCAPKSQQAYLDMPLEFFVGKFVKLGFDGVRPDTGEVIKENMWVFCDGLADVELGVELLGELRNDPILLMRFKCGDGVGFDRSEVMICDVDGGRTRN